MSIDPQAIADLQRQLTTTWHERPPSVPPQPDALLACVAQNHLRNFQLWHEEDVARRDDVGFERIYQAKRAIDRHNQERNNFIEEMDQALVAILHPRQSGCPKNSETPGMIIDRLSILALKEFHMREETERSDASQAHRNTCSAKLARIVLQRNDLIQCLRELLEGITAGTRSFAVYYQFKMYNDPALNPQLYQQGK